MPEDDGAADHLTGMELPPLELGVAGGGRFDLREAATIGTLVAFVYPRTGTPGQPLVPGWDDIPGARGCTPQSCAFRDRHFALGRPGRARWPGSARWTRPSSTPSPSASSCPTRCSTTARCCCATQLGLPTFDVCGTTLYKRLTFVARAGRIEKVFYPVFPPDRNAAEVEGWLARARSA